MSEKPKAGISPWTSLGGLAGTGTGFDFLGAVTSAVPEGAAYSASPPRPSAHGLSGSSLGTLESDLDIRGVFISWLSVGPAPRHITSGNGGTVVILFQDVPH